MGADIDPGFWARPHVATAPGHIFITNSGAGEVIALDAHDLEEVSHWEISGAPTKIAFVGILGEGDHHEEGHDDHGHDDHGHDDHDHDDHGKDKHDEHGHDDHDDHGHDEFDPHVWLDPVNAKALVHEIEEALSDADPANAGTYEANARALMDKLDALVEEVQTELNPVKNRGFIVFHDAYQHFETRFGMSAVGSITVSPEVMPGAERIRELQEKVNSLDAGCVFSEPQFEPKLVSTVTENTNAGTGVLDPLGASIPDGPGLYFTLIRNMASALKECLSGKG